LTHINKNRFIENQLTNLKEGDKVPGSASRVLKVYDNGEISVINERNGECYVNIIFCPHCQAKTGKDVITGGFQWIINPNGMYGSLTFLKLAFACSTCYKETPLPAGDVITINKYSSDNIDKVHFPFNTRTAIKDQIAGMKQY
jgi:hypothetical protein